MSPALPKTICVPSSPQNDLCPQLSHDLQPQPEAAPDILARRLSLSLTGLTLSLERVDQFVANYHVERKTAIEQLVDELLSSQAYAEHFAWGWLDAARYADTNGNQVDGFPGSVGWRAHTDEMHA
ncbi:MAG: DUF1549 domain-containing protein [Pirellulaceae bacterium]|nr:DUF1549 domain-containing protein [Pirellulaceae bacterium]